MVAVVSSTASLGATGVASAALLIERKTADIINEAGAQFATTAANPGDVEIIDSIVTQLDRVAEEAVLPPRLPDRFGKGSASPCLAATCL